MKKIDLFFIGLGAICFLLCFGKTFQTFKKINDDIPVEVYLEVGQKHYTKENIIKYYKQVIRYICYFIYFIDYNDYEWEFV